MKPLSLILLLQTLCLLTTLKAQVLSVETLTDNGPLDKRINFVFLAEGYRSNEQNVFLNDAGDISTDLFNEPPFSNYANFFNVVAIKVASQNSSTDHPGTANNVSEPVHPVNVANTYFDSSFDFYDIHRLLVPNNTSGIFSVLSINYPQYDQAIILVNSPYYGGSGGQFPTVSTHYNASEIAIHELGHSFADLKDEYFPGDIYAEESYNMTQEINSAIVPWSEWMGEEGVGIYQHCCSSSSSSWYRPHQNCKMRNISSPFCAVCKQQIINKIYELVTPISSFYPGNQNLFVSFGHVSTFDLNLIYPIPNTLSIKWYLNGSLINQNAENIEINAYQYTTGLNVVTAEVIDNTSLSKSYLPENGYKFTVSWNINYNNDCPTTQNITTGGIGNGLYKAAGQIYSDNTVYSNQSVKFIAGQRISLKENFKVRAGADFGAYIEHCADEDDIDNDSSISIK